MKYQVEVDLEDLENLYSFVPLRNRRKFELEAAKNILEKYEKIPKERGFIAAIKDAAKYSELKEGVRKAERLFEINESTFHCWADSLEEFLEDIFKQIGRTE